MATRAISGTRAQIFVDGVNLGYALSISGTETQSVARIDTLGDAYTKEIVTLRRTVQLSASMVRIFEGSAKALGLMARGETSDLMNFPPLTIVIYDGIEDTAIETITGAVITQRSFSTDAGGLMSENVSFEAVRTLDEGEAA